jgi:glycine C-acetyltransferase
MDSEQISLQGTLSDFLASQDVDPGGEGGPAHTQPASLLGRYKDLPVLWDEILGLYGVDTFAKQIHGPLLPMVDAMDRRGRSLGTCLNFASQDYLALSFDPAVREAARQAIDAHGVHAAGSPALVGNSQPSVALEEAMASWLQCAEVTLFPTGWGACFGAIKLLVRRHDHVVMDELAHASLQEGARSATANVHVFRHLSLESLERRLQRIRQLHPRAGVLVVTESLYSMDSDVPDLRAHQALATRYGATLLVDMAHDLGVLGELTGRGALETQNMLGQIDVIVGSFSKAFAANGGFVATSAPGLKLALRFGAGPLTFSTGLSPVQAAVALCGLQIVQSPQGMARRQRLMKSALAMRAALVEAGFTLLGQPSAIVPVLMGGVARSRLMARFLVEQGVLVNLVEHPAVSRNASRLRLQLMASHEATHIRTCVAAVQEAARQADALLGEINAGRDQSARLV